MHSLAFWGGENKSKCFQIAKYHVTNMQQEVLNSAWSHLGPRCTNSPQKLQVEVHCLGPESPETAIRSTHNDYFNIMHFGNHAFCAYRTAQQSHSRGAFLRLKATRNL